MKAFRVFRHSRTKKPGRLWRVLRYPLVAVLALVWGLTQGFAQGVYIAWHELRYRRYVDAHYKGIRSIYDMRVWYILRMITEDKATDWQGNTYCQQCNKATTSLHCHHKKPIAERPDLAFTPGNLEMLCVPCHQTHHPHMR